RAQHVQDVIAPALAAGKIVLCDRFSDATIAYQGYGRGLDLDTIRKISDIATVGLKPSLTILFDLPVEMGLARAKERVARLAPGQDAEDRFEQEALQFHERIRAGYLDIASRQPERFCVVDAAGDVAQVQDEVRHALEQSGVLKASR
ncbi:MAG: dTMP kinase, partial [Smithellaceae bacterium]|nr:dTMP kinase [Smithellaceae bacterium]